MHVAFDAVMLSLYLHPGAKPPKPIADLPARIQLLIDELEAAGAKIIIATPVLSEFLVLTGPLDGPRYLADLTNTDVFDIQPFDTRAAIEAAEMQRKAKAAGDKKAGSEQRWQVAKVDRQLVAVAKVNNVECIYSDDDGVQKMAASAGIKTRGIADLPTPPEQEADLFRDVLTEEEFASLDTSTDVSPSSDSEPPSEQFHGDGQGKVVPLVPARPAGHQASQGQPQQDSSPPAAPPPPSKK